MVSLESLCSYTGCIYFYRHNYDKELVHRWCTKLSCSIIDHDGTSWLHTSVLSLRFLHHLGPAALSSVNCVETYTLVCNL